mmetsp:Transcript_10507/g.17053  ORF Transcript_10507/g.17053 Transcript_10507/m.17053 type:complete len:350 (-) Transcript_10507:1206-2255(-)
MLLGVQRMVRPAAHGGGAAFVEFHAHGAGDMFLALIDCRLQHLTLRGIPEAVVDQLCVLRHQLIFQVHFAAIHGDGLDATVRLKQHGASRGFVDATGFHTNKATLNQVQTANAVLAAVFVQLGQDGGRAHRLAVDADRVTFFKANFDELRLVWRVLRMHGALINIIRRSNGRIFQHFTFRGRVQQVGVHRERRLATFVFGNGDLVLLCKFQQFGSRGQVPLPPRRNHLDVGVERIGGQLEPHLIVAFAGCAMRHGVCTGRFGNLNQTFGNQRTRNRGAQQVQTFIDRIGAEHRENKVAHKLFSHIFDVDVFRLDAQEFRLRTRWFELFALTQVCGEGHHLTAIFGLQPL